MSRTDARPAPSPPDATVACLDDEEAVAAAHAVVTSSVLTVAFARGLLLDGGVRESIAKRYARSLTLSINDEADRAVEHVALDKKLTFFATVLPETTSAAASFTLKMAFNSTAPRGFAPAGFAPLSDSLKDDDETQLDSARISPPKKKRRRGPEDHPSFLSSGIPVCSQDSVVSSRSYGDDAYLF
ncbi:hypothetical protein JL721_582 [Aureococcus anophagefferens]|nr:hypothetical protein JL721_582 [Aureococcus anophagefferens]